MHVYCHYFEHTTITHICNHLKQLIKFNYLLYKNLKKYNHASVLDSEKESRVGIFEEKGQTTFSRALFCADYE